MSTIIPKDFRIEVDSVDGEHRVVLTWTAQDLTTPVAILATSDNANRAAGLAAIARREMRQLVEQWDA